ncbi:MAG: 5'-nucleotidase C-terminal domain-containing protein [Bacteroidales bacterium]|nr:5'-nucleotidase C-terminal domain-containing protein [Bacteroidales bacterium]
MKKQNILILLALAITIVACSSKQYTVTHATSAKIAIDASTETLADKNYETYLQPVKQKIDAEMNIVIGQAAETMKAHAPESLLSNFSADVYKLSATEYLKQPVDIGIVNLGGLRTEIPAGNITIRKVFELMPFENELVILWLKGDKLDELLQFFAKVGGEGVSGIRMTIANNKAVDITINGQTLDMDKWYSIATNDYLAGGNDKMVQLAMYEKRVNTGIKIRNILLDYIKSETKKGKVIQSKLDGRITLIP